MSIRPGLFLRSGGYYGFCFLTPQPAPPPLQCIERCHCYRSNEATVIASLLKFAGYIHNSKIVPENIFGLILNNKMASMGDFFTISREFCWPSRAKGVIGRDVKFVEYDHHYKILTGNVFASF